MIKQIFLIEEEEEAERKNRQLYECQNAKRSKKPVSLY